MPSKTNVAGRNMIDGVLVTPLKRIPHPKGDILHALKASEDCFHGIGEIYFSSILKNEIKGWKKHSKMILNLVVPVGSIRFVIFDDRLDSVSRGEFFELAVNKENYCRLTVPSGVWFAFEGEGMELNLLLNIANIEHDPNEVQNMELNEIDYDW